MAPRTMRLALVVLIAVIQAMAAGLAPTKSLPAAGSQGSLAGVVTDFRGIPQMGAAVALLAADGRILQKLFTNDRGFFQVERLAPGQYSLRVSLANFLPVTRENVVVEPGGRAFLSINLTSLSAALAGLTGTARPRQDSDDDWKWVVRSSGGTRPILRYQPGSTNGSLTAAAWRRPDYKARVEFSGGGARSDSFGSEADLSTGFSYSQTLFSDTTLLLGGNLGYERSTPATAFRGVLRRERPGGSTPQLAVTVRQIFLPGAYFERGVSGDGNLQSITLSLEDSTRLGDFLRLEYGTQYDTTSFVNRLHTVSPFGRATMTLSPTSTLLFIYTEGLPRHSPERLAGGDPLREVASDLSLYPRVSVRKGSLAIQRGRHMEVAFRQKLAARSTFEASAYRDVISNLTVGAAPSGAEIGSRDFLPDVFTQYYSYNSGRHHSSGVRVAYQQQFGDHLQGAIAYSFADMLAPERQSLLGQSLDDLREILRMQNRHILALKLGAHLPGTKTRLLTSYKWTSGPPILSGDLYDDSLGRADANLNILIRQPLPPLAFVGRMEALADFRNLLAQGYIPIVAADGRRVILLQNVRSFRGGFSFNF